MQGLVNRHILEELAKFSEWWWCSEVGCKRALSTNFKGGFTKLDMTFKEYVTGHLGVSVNGDFHPSVYKHILDVYSEYYDPDGKVLRDYRQMNEIVNEVGVDVYETWLVEKKNEQAS